MSFKVPRWVELYKDEAFPAASGSKIYPVDRSNQILELCLAVRATNGATRNFADNSTFQDIREALTLIEVSSGSDIYKSYTSEICALVASYNDGCPPPEIATMTGAAEQELYLPIPFGCFPGDQEVLLPAPLKTSLNMKLMWDFSASATEGFAAAGFEFDLLALTIPPESPEIMRSKQVLVTKKKHDHTTAASGVKRFPMSIGTGGKLRRIYTHCYEAGIGEGVDINYLKLEANSQPVTEGPWNDLQYINARQRKLQYARDVTVVGAASDVWITRIPKVMPQFSSHTAAGADYIASITADSITFAANAITGKMRLISDVLPAMAVIDFDPACDQRNLLSQDIASLELLATQGAAGGTVQVIEEYLAKFW